MKKIIVIQNAQVGVYGVDVDGNYWCSFTFTGSGATVTCTRCGAAISSGYTCGLYPDALPYCASHVQWVYPEEDATGSGVRYTAIECRDHRRLFRDKKTKRGDTL